MTAPPPLPPRPPGFHQAEKQQQQQQQLWQPSVGTSWNYVLHDRVRLDETIEQCAVWIIDLFDNSEADVAALHARGRRVVAYFSAGTCEQWRPDASQFPAAGLARKMDGWAGERWVDTRSAGVRQVMARRLDLARRKGFDGVDPDNVDAYDNNDSGLALSRRDAADYVLWLAAEAHARGLSVGLKNAADIVPGVADRLQWCVNEQAVQYGDEEHFAPFVRLGKPVFHVEYPKGEDPDSDRQNDLKDVTGRKKEKCLRGREHGFSTIIKNVRLDQWIQTC